MDGSNVSAARARVFSPSGVVFLESKLLAPPIRREWVIRRDLVDGLVASAGKPLVLIDAPVGYGKTTLMLQWKAVDPRPFVWVNLDRVDNDPARFWTYVLEAIRRAHPSVGGWTEAVPPSRDTLQHVHIPRLLNELGTSPQPFVLVLDDYHHIKNAGCHELAIMLLDNLPETMQMVVSSRADPPLDIGRRRVGGAIFEVRAAQLRFSADDADTMMSQVLGRKLTGEQVERLTDQTEGWPAGLYLAAISLRDRPDADSFIQDFSGSNHHVADYLTTEILARLPDDVRQFLLRTSILDAFNAELCDAVVGSSGAAAMIDYLESSNQLVVAIDENREWYRYHQLFGDLLRSELRRTYGVSVREFHRRARDWFAKEKLISEAVHHAVEAGDREVTRELISASWYPYLNAGRIETVRSWLSAVGEEEVAEDPVLSLTAAWASALVGEIEEAERWVASARLGSVVGPLPDGAVSLDSGIALITALFGLGGVSVAIDDARRALELESSSGYWRAVALTALGSYSYLSGDLETAEAALTEALAPSHFQQPVLEIVGRSELAMVYSDRGDQERAKRLAHEARDLMEQQGLSGVPQASLVFLALGRVSSDSGDLHGARDYLETGLQIRAKHPGLSPWATMQMLLELAPVRFALGDQEGARDLLREGRALIESRPDAGVIPERLGRLERSLGRSSQRPALFGEPLTDRELAVLRLLPKSLTHREIATELYISLNTVKSHVRAIYRKMDVTSRADALDRAQELELI